MAVQSGKTYIRLTGIGYADNPDPDYWVDLSWIVCYEVENGKLVGVLGESGNWIRLKGDIDWESVSKRLNSMREE